MKQIVAITITDEDIRCDVETAAQELEEENQVAFPDSDARSEFIDDCVSCILDKFDFYEHYCPDYSIEILDTAKLYGYLCD